MKPVRLAVRGWDGGTLLILVLQFGEDSFVACITVYNSYSAKTSFVESFALGYSMSRP